MDEGGGASQGQRSRRDILGASRATKYRRIAEEAASLLFVESDAQQSDIEPHSPVEPSLLEHTAVSVSAEEASNDTSDESNSCYGVPTTHSTDEELLEGAENSQYVNEFVQGSDEDTNGGDDDISICSFISNSDTADDGSMEEFLVSDEGEMSDAAPDEEPDRPQPSLRERLRVWAVSKRISQVAVNQLLKILKSANPAELQSLPLDARTLVHTPVSTGVRLLPSGGQFAYFGLARGIAKALELINGRVSLKNGKVKLAISFDGLPLFRASGGHFWPILGKVISSDDINHHVFPIALHHNDLSKPNDVYEYLDEFIKELSDVCENGIQFKGEHYPAELSGCICDAPAKSFILNIVNFNGKHSCTKCKTKGVWSRLCQRMYYPNLEAAPRTHDEFLRQTDVEFHRGTSPFCNYKAFNFLAHFPLDYLHLVALGICKKLVKLWVFKSKNNAQLSPELISIASGRLSVYEKFIPTEFGGRRGRPLEAVKFWKATEFRTFVLYLGPFAMDGILSKVALNNFFLLHIPLRLLMNPSQCKEFKETARAVLIQFVEDCKTTYAPNLLTHNFHSIIHLPDNLENFDNMEDCASWDFESYLHSLKQLIVRGKGNVPLPQAVKRLEESMSCPQHENASNRQFPYASMPHRKGPLLTGFSSPQYMNLHFKSFRLGISARDCCFTRKDGSIIVIRNICSDIATGALTVIGRRFLHKEDAYTAICPSSKLGVFFVSQMSELIAVPIGEVLHKNMILPFKTGFITQPLLHTM